MLLVYFPPIAKYEYVPTSLLEQILPQLVYIYFNCNFIITVEYYYYRLRILKKYKIIIFMGSKLVQSKNCFSEVSKKVNNY